MAFERWPRTSAARCCLIVFGLCGATTTSLAVSPAERVVIQHPAPQLDNGPGARSTKSLTTRSATYPTIIADHAAGVEPRFQYSPPMMHVPAPDR